MIYLLVGLLAFLALYYRSRIPDPELMKDVQWFAQATGWKSPKSVGREIHRIFYENNTLRRCNERQERLIEDLSTRESNLENEAHTAHATASEWRQRAERAERDYFEMKAEAEEIIESKEREIDSWFKKNAENLRRVKDLKAAAHATDIYRGTYDPTAGGGWWCSISADAPTAYYYKPDYLAAHLGVEEDFTREVLPGQSGKISGDDCGRYLRAISWRVGDTIDTAFEYSSGDPWWTYDTTAIKVIFEWDHDLQAWKAC